MKKITVSIVAATLTLSSFGQTTKPKPKVPVKTTAAPVLKNQLDSASYAIGMSVANFYKQQGVTTLNSQMVVKGMNDVLTSTPVLINDYSANTCVMNFLNAAGAAKAKPRIEEGKKFLATNKTKPNVKTTASGLQYEIIEEGTGEQPTSATDKVTCHYKGTLLDGFEFDNSYKRGEPATFALNNVIAGWTEGLQLMHVGSKYRFWVPYNLGYGLNDYSSIPGGSTLVFEVELLKVEK